MLNTQAIGSRPGAAPAQPAPPAPGAVATPFSQLLAEQAPPPSPPTTNPAKAPEAAPAHAEAPAPTPSRTSSTDASRNRRALPSLGRARTEPDTATAKTPDAASTASAKQARRSDGDAERATDAAADAAEPAIPEDTTEPTGDAALGEFTRMLALPNASNPAPGPADVATGTVPQPADLATAGQPAAGRAGAQPAFTVAPGTDAADEPGSTRAGRQEGAATAATSAPTSTAPARRHAALGADPARPAASASALASAGTPPTAPSIGEAAGPTFSQALAIAGRSAEGSPAPLAPDANPAPLSAAAFNLTAPQPSGASNDIGTPTAHVKAPVHSPAFAPELAARVSVMAAEGIHSAELQLNPAEMGPVSVEIVVQGDRAHVSFAAAQADTRQALEQSLPDLAAALRDGGLTLSGGGVFQQPPQQQAAQGGDAEPSAARSGSASRPVPDAIDLATAALSRPPMSPPRGLLDTFA